MPIVHVKKNSHNYRRDIRLSWKARGILAYLLDHEDDWEVSVQDLIAQSSKDGRISIQSALQELLKTKYAKLETMRDPLGKVQGKHYVIYEAPYDIADSQETCTSGTDLADKQDYRQSGNLLVGKNPTSLLVVADKQETCLSAPTSRFSVRQETCSIKDLKTKTKDKEKKEGDKSRDISTSRQAQNALLTHQAEEVLAYLNQIQGRNLERTTQIRALLGTGVSVEDCKLVIDWLYHVERLQNPAGYEKYANNITPFRPDNFDVNRDKARRWKTGVTTQPHKGKLAL